MLIQLIASIFGCNEKRPPVECMTYSVAVNEDGVMKMTDVKPVECEDGYKLTDECKCEEIKEFKVPDDKYRFTIPKKPYF